MEGHLKCFMGPVKVKENPDTENSFNKIMVPRRGSITLKFCDTPLIQNLRKFKLLSDIYYTKKTSVIPYVNARNLLS